jgi:hypothetical protein
MFMGPEGGPEPMEHLDPLVEQRRIRRPWEIRSAQWRAWTLAEAAFGCGVEVRWTGRLQAVGFRGLFTVSVPFRGLHDHRERESLFLAWARQDPVLTRVPLMFCFDPIPVLVP